MIIIADTSALVALAVCDSLDLLIQLFDKISVPISVFKECTVPGKAQSDKLNLFLFDKISDVIFDHTLQLPANLGKGEVDAMILYKKTNADYLLIDDNRARKVAQINGINIIGSLGVLVLAKNQNLIKKVSPFLQKLENSDIFFDNNLIEQIKKISNE
jgi:uncharacterized protein